MSNSSQKANINQRINIELIGGLKRSAQKRGETTAHMLERAVSEFLANDVELTSHERQRFLKEGIELELDSLSSGLNIELKGDLLSKTMTTMAICSGLDTLFPLRESTAKAKLHLFDVLILIKDYDKGLFEEIFPYLKKFKKLHAMYTQTVF